MKRLLPLIYLFFFAEFCFAQNLEQQKAKVWADSVYASLTPEQRIAQLMIIRLSSIDMKTKQVKYLYDAAQRLVQQYNVGGICLFQGRADTLALQLNRLQKMARTPILVSVDGEWGLSMRLFDQVLQLPKQMMLGGLSDSSIIYRYGKVVANQCKRLGVHMNYAPVVDVNNNPNNPVINDRSFGEDKEKVASFGIQYMKGLQENGVMACAKHFPGHGDVSVDSHLDLPIITKTKAALDTLELYPFKKMIEAGVASMMVAHLFIPAIDSAANRPTSLSANNIKNLLQKELKYHGLVVTDALEMMGVKKFYPNGEGSVEALIAGADMLCLPDSVDLVISKVKNAIDSNRLSWDDIAQHCKRVLQNKYIYHVNELSPIDTAHLLYDLNKEVIALRKEIAEKAITLVAHEDVDAFHWGPQNDRQTAYLGIGINQENSFSKGLSKKYQTNQYFFDFNRKSSDSLLVMANQIIAQNKRVIIGIHQINRAPAYNFGMSKQALQLIDALQKRIPVLICLFGNAYAAKNWGAARNLIVAYEDDSIVHQSVIRLINGEIPFRGKLPVSISQQMQYGRGLQAYIDPLPFIQPEKTGIDKRVYTKIDSLVQDAMNKKAMPGCTVMIVKDGNIILDKAYGYHTYAKLDAVKTNTVYDVASLTKILGSNLCIMKLFEEGKLDLEKPIGDYLPSVRNTDKAKIQVKKLLLHEAGLKAYIPFYKETINGAQKPMNAYYCSIEKDCYATRVANDLMIRSDMVDTFYKRILEYPIESKEKYVYSDNDFIFLGKIIEQLSGMTLNNCVNKWFYAPMGLNRIGYLPYTFLRRKDIAPTVSQNDFRGQELRGDVHDQGAAIMGGVAGHAGIFSDSRDVASIMQMLLNKGEWNGKRFLKPETINMFTAYQSSVSRRGLGFDKPEKENKTLSEPYPAQYVSDATFGHTGFTGTCTWADPATGMIFVFLSNRIYPSDNGVFKTLNIRSKIHDTFAALFKKQNDAASN